MAAHDAVCSVERGRCGADLSNEGTRMQKWYRGMTKGQKVFVYVVSTALILCAGIGLLPLAVLIYLELGNKDEAA